MKFFHIVQIFIFQKVFDLYHATLFTAAQYRNAMLRYSAGCVAYLQMCSYTICYAASRSCLCSLAIR
jgi:hypothetical protein